jgi:GTP-binding protein Era
MPVSALSGYQPGCAPGGDHRPPPPGPRYYPEDQLTDQQERFVAAELIREQAL